MEKERRTLSGRNRSVDKWHSVRFIEKSPRKEETPEGLQCPKPYIEEAYYTKAL